MTPVRRVPRKSPRTKSAFTLIEMLSVAAIIIILASIAIPNVLGAMERARNTQCRVLLQSLKAAVASYHTDTRQWPESGSDRLYLILGGYYPYSGKASKRYKPPYIDFSSGSVAGLEYGDPTKAGGYAERKISLVDTRGATVKTLEKTDLYIPLQPPGKDQPLPWQPILDPWERPIVYISPDDLRKRFNDDPSLSNVWKELIAMDSERAAAETNFANVPFGLNSGQFWSAGRDGFTAVSDGRRADDVRDDDPVRGKFQPGNLLGYDRRNNDSEGEKEKDLDLVDSSDAKAKGENVLAEDDLASW